MILRKREEFDSSWNPALNPAHTDHVKDVPPVTPEAEQCRNQLEVLARELVHHGIEIILAAIIAFLFAYMNCVRSTDQCTNLLCGAYGGLWGESSLEGRLLAPSVAELCDEVMDASIVAAIAAPIWSSCRFRSKTGCTARSACMCMYSFAHSLRHVCIYLCMKILACT